MKGYFSQLAQHTGLSFEHADATAASNLDATPAALAQQPGSEPPAPLHVEEITFSVPAAPAPPETSVDGLEGLRIDESKTISTQDEAQSGQTESSDDKHSTSSSQMPPTLIETPRESAFEESSIQFTKTESSTREASEQYVEKQTHTNSERSVHFSDEPLDEALESGPKEKLEGVEIVTRRFVGRDETRAGNKPATRLEGVGRESNAGEPSDAMLDARMEREVFVHNYLKEVRAWVAATPLIEEEEYKQQRESKTPREGSDALMLEHEAEASSVSQDARAAELEVQDLNLSIGSISIVIEEPKQSVAASLAPPPRVESVPARAASEPTRLSRYYLRNW